MKFWLKKATCRGNKQLLRARITIYGPCPESTSILGSLEPPGCPSRALKIDKLNFVSNHVDATEAKHRNCSPLTAYLGHIKPVGTWRRWHIQVIPFAAGFVRELSAQRPPISARCRQLRGDPVESGRQTILSTAPSFRDAPQISLARHYHRNHGIIAMVLEGVAVAFISGDLSRYRR